MKNSLAQLAQDYEDCLRLELNEQEIQERELKYHIKKIKKLIRNLRKIDQKYNKILK